MQAQTSPPRSILARIFISPDERRLRAGWRLLIHTILFIFVLGIATTPLVLSGFNPESNDPTVLILAKLVEAAVLILTIWFARRFIDRRSFVSLGNVWKRKSFHDLMAGIWIAFIILAVMFVVFLTFGWIDWQGWAWEFGSFNSALFTLFLYFLLFVIVGYEEELWVRGYILQNLEDGLNLFWAFLISSSIFSLLHLGNPGATFMSVLGILLAGFFLGYAYIVTRTLWLAVGLHIGWNFFLSPFFGFPVSGLETPGMMRFNVVGPDLWTGGRVWPRSRLNRDPDLNSRDCFGMGICHWEQV